MEKIIRGILEILEAAKTAAEPTDPIKKVKSFFFGDPIIIPASMLPAIVVSPVSENVTARGTGVDQADSTIKIKLIQNLKDDLGASAVDPENVKLTENAVRLFEERDTNGKIKPVSIVGAIRSNPEIPYQGVATCQWNGAFSIEYGFTDSRGYVAFETNLNIIAKTISDRL